MSDENKKPWYPCLIFDEYHYTKECPHHTKVSKIVKSSPTPTVLKDPFPPQDSEMVFHDQYSSSALENIMMMSSKVMVSTRSKDYTSKSLVEDEYDSSAIGQTSTSMPPSSELLHIEKPNPNMTIHLPHKGMLQNSAFSPHARDA